MRPFRFAASAAPDVVGMKQAMTIARTAESIGFSTLVFQDHLVRQHAPIPLLTVAAAATERIQICPYVLNVDLRHPAVIAQDLASLDILSEGRLLIGLGGGWSRREYEAIGIPFDPIGTRTARLQEYIDVLRGCFSAKIFSYSGENYSIADHDGQPKPVQRPSPPLLIGGGGRQMLGLAAREADVVGLAPRLPPSRPGGLFMEPASITVAATAEKIRWVRDAAGSRFEQLELSTHVSGWPTMITNNARVEAGRIIDEIRSRTDYELTVDEVLQSPHVWIGTVKQLAEKCLFLRTELGISNYMLGRPEVVADVVESLAGE